MTSDGLTPTNDPLALFQSWLGAAYDAGLPLPESMTLATVGRDGRPSARVVLYKGAEAGGQLFFTNYESRKANELADHPCAALVFHWPSLERQIRIEGQVKKTSRVTSEAYHASRPRDSQLSAWASPQSAEVSGRADLERRLEDVKIRMGEGLVPCPPFWGGYLLIPDYFEFWQGLPNRFHDRLALRRRGDGWESAKLAP